MFTATEESLLLSNVQKEIWLNQTLHPDIGSITIDEDLMDASGMIEHEEVQVLNITNGSRLTTYAIKGKKGSRCIKINGAAAHHVSVDDLIIIVAYCQLESHEVESHKPQIVHVDSNNKIISIYDNESSA